ncbi:caspase family protein [Runella sp. MFBS21]|uniref:caspase family protein n=1 Tax=Runella sp. MFBS21 TaxID=3034018 RepID=UPI0023FA2A29|nr:caspase family protein [Runella sp. MFBS21]MDF7821838.1 caspase family protein [Runella sp. MFBS21]
MRTFFYYSLFFLFSLGLLSTPAFAQPTGMKPIDKSQMPAGTEQWLALVVGNKDYIWADARLQNLLNDANGVAAALQTLGFEVILRKNLTQSDFLRNIDDFGDRLRQYDVGLFYYSGHGVQHNGENYLVPIDANTKTAQKIEYATAPRSVVQNGNGVFTAALLKFLQRGQRFDDIFRIQSMKYDNAQCPFQTSILRARKP